MKVHHRNEELASRSLPQTCGIFANHNPDLRNADATQVLVSKSSATTLHLRLTYGQQDLTCKMQ
ncbi:hypothetical protein HAX54_017160, partial [Datura stramonium]|nr:hypothetical protein [Datura stramonium]